MIKLNLTKIDDLKKLKCGDELLLFGTIYTARDAAHKRITELIHNKEKLPFSFKNAILYYAGPTPTKPGQIVGSIGPTTSSRMDKFAGIMKDIGVIATIGKGPRSQDCINIYRKDKIIYLITTGGIGALLSKCVTSCEEIAFKDLGPESIKKITIENFPAIVALDYEGNVLDIK